MKYLVIMVSLLVTFVSVTEGSQIKKASLQPKSVEPMAQDQRSQQLRVEIEQVVKTLPTELAPSQRLEFASIINLLVAKRIVENVHGYERTLQFQKDFAQTYAKFLDTLDSGTPVFKQDEIDEFVKASISAFDRNEQQFQSFVEKVVKTDPQLKDMSVPEVRKRLLQFSAWIYINDNQNWRRIIRITFLWPWCHSDKPSAA
jgi:hypothetical protein